MRRFSSKGKSRSDGRNGLHAAERQDDFDLGWDVTFIGTNTHPQRRFFLLFLAAGLLLSVLSCRKDSGSPEAQILAQIRRAETAAEKRKPKVLKEMISDQYADDEGNHKKQIAGLLALRLLRNDDIHLLTQVRSVELTGKDRASVQLFVAMAAGAIRDPSDLSRLRAHLYRFDLLFALEGGKWRVIRAAWRTTGPGDFL